MHIRSVLLGAAVAAAMALGFGGMAAYADDGGGGGGGGYAVTQENTDINSTFDLFLNITGGVGLPLDVNRLTFDDFYDVSLLGICLAVGGEGGPDVDPEPTPEPEPDPVPGEDFNFDSCSIAVRPHLLI